MSVDDVPPIIQIGPTNQTVSVHSTAIFPCRAIGNPVPSIKWSKNSELLAKGKSDRIFQGGDMLQIKGKI